VTDYLRHLGGRKGNRPSTIDFSNHQRGSDAEDGQSLAENLSWRGDDEAIQGELLELLTKRAGSQVARAAKLFWDGYTTREIAVRIGVSVRNISKKLEQAKMVIIEAGYSI